MKQLLQQNKANQAASMADTVELAQTRCAAREPRMKPYRFFTPYRRSAHHGAVRNHFQRTGAGNNGPMGPFGVYY